MAATVEAEGETRRVVLKNLPAWMMRDLELIASGEGNSVPAVCRRLIAKALREETEK